MRKRDATLELSATDLSNFLGCRHRTALDMAVAHGNHDRAPKTTDPLLEMLFARGLEHERLYVASLVASGITPIDLTQYDKDRDGHVAETLKVMRAGERVIVQGALRDGRWFGKPDILRRVETPSNLGAWSYEVADTKLARETKAGTILQLGLYSEMLALAQGIAPECFHVITPYAQHEYRLNDFAAYFRLVKSQMLGTVELDHDEVAATYYPEPVAHCDICQWALRCKQRRRDDDHLSLVAGISRVQRRELESRGISRLEQLAELALPLEFKPSRGSVETYVRVREQARLQFHSRNLDVPLFELRDIVEQKDEGLCRLPEPSEGDMFLDLEGDPFAAEGGREYLFGLVTLDGGQPNYQAFWGFDERAERAAFEQVMDLITSAWKVHPGMHIYHYAPYEPSAFKRLMGRYITREHELDNLLRGGKFVDLYGVIRQGVRVGTERYSIKNLEPLYAFRRTVRLYEAGRCLRVMEQALETNSPHTVPAEVLEAVRGYNEDDCVSTLRLRDWLERVRADHIADGWEIPRPALPEETIAEPKARELLVRALRAKLLAGVSDMRDERGDEQQARWLLAYLLDYHHREAKSVWWEYYRLREMPEEDLYDEPQAIAGLAFVKRVEVVLNKNGKPTGKVVDRYHYPLQEMECERGSLQLREVRNFGDIVKVDRTARTVDVLKPKAVIDLHPTSVFAHTFIPTTAQEASLVAIAERVLADGGIAIGGSGADQAGRALLLTLAPMLSSGTFTGVMPDKDIVTELRRVVLSLDHSVLSVQGPPGAGKTYCGAEMICALVAAGKKVGVAATSHKVIRNLLDCVVEAAIRNGQRIGIAHKVAEDDFVESGVIVRLEGNADAVRVLADGEARVVGGTSWLWARADLANSVDVLFVDEAGQMALANAIAMSPSAKSIVLLGDPQQLEQPRKGSHPDGVSVSALEHMLCGHKTVPNGRGVFLPETWRMCPTITAFTSEMFYETRLGAKDGLELQRLDSAGALDGNGLWMVRMDHDGNRTSSPEEIDAVESLIARLTSSGVTWTDGAGKRRALIGSDILVVAPYNAQVSRLAERVARLGARVGTVDKFQGQEAPVVIYSLATSRPEDAPRGMEFLYSLNRLNVATSRARCAAIIVANARLLEPECRTPRQMKLANALCRYRELSVRYVEPDDGTPTGAVPPRGQTSPEE